MDPAEKDAKPAETEEDLNELLDSCLDDFNKPILKTMPISGAQNKAAPQALGSSNASASTKTPDAATWSEEFKQFNEMMENYLDDEGELSDMKKWMSSLSGGQPPLDTDDNFAQSFAETIRELTEQAQNIPDTSPEDLASLLGGLDMGDQMGDPGQMPEIMPLMQNVMQRLMSKELLYPSIKETAEKYPDWLREKQATLKTEEYDNYKLQYELMGKVCEEFEKESDGSEASKKEQFEKVLQLMQKNPKLWQPTQRACVRPWYTFR